MLLIVLAFLGGILTIFSPCILPVIPFVFARAEQPFRRATLPMLVGMAVTFALFAGLATAGGSWIVRTNQYGRVAAMVVLAVLGLTLLLPSLAERLTRPLVRLGSRLQSGQQRGPGAAASPAGSFVLGASVGLLWAPCAGPILGLVLAAAALSGVTPRTLALLAAFAFGAATSLAVALLAGNRVFQAMKRGLGAEEWVRRVLGVLVLAGVAAIALGLDTRFLARFSYLNTNGVEQKLVAHLSTPKAVPVHAGSATLEDDGPMPPLDGAVAWINSPPLTVAGLRGKVVVVDFWTYSCINCLRSLPYVKAWAAKYADQGLVVIGVHSPEFAFERDLANVQKAVKDLGITYPVAVDSQLAIWGAFDNSYWPAHYFVDATGEIRGSHFGEGGYDESERVIQQLLAEAHHTTAPAAEPLISASVDATGRMAPADADAIGSPETYIGYHRGERFASPQKLATDMALNYTAPSAPGLNQWGLQGDWKVGAEKATLQRAGGAIVYDFHARDLHLVMGSATAQPVRFKVTLDGHEPGPNHGVDTDEHGLGTVTGDRLYQLIRQTGPIANHIFKIEFLDPGVAAFSFTFG